MIAKPLSQRIEEYQKEERKSLQVFAGVAFFVVVAILGGGFLVFSTREETPAVLKEPAQEAKPLVEKEEEAPKKVEAKPVFERGNYSVNILNGSSNSDHFQELSEALKSLGYKVSEGKAQYSSYTVLNLGVASGSELESYLKTDLQKVFPNVAVDNLDENEEFDAVIIVGKF